MQVFAELFRTPVGIASALTILGITVIAAFLFFWIKRQVDSDSKNIRR